MRNGVMRSEIIRDVVMSMVSRRITPFSISKFGTVRAVHEIGHNVSELHLHSNPNYKYEQEGLQNRSPNKPSIQNTINIINDKRNRRTIK